MSFAACASPASSLSEFSVISHPLSPSNSAVLVEPGSDDDEIVFSPRPPTHAEHGRGRPSASGIDSDDDFILIASPRAQRAPSLQASMTGLALSLHPASSSTQPTDEPPVTPTQADTAAPPAAPGLPTPSSSDSSNRSVARAVPTSRPSSPTQPAPAAKPVHRGKFKSRRAPRALATAAASAASYPSPSPSPVQVATPTVATAIINPPTSRYQRRSATSGAIHDNEQQSARPASRSQRKQPKFEHNAKLQVLAESCEGIGARGVVVEDDDDMTLYQAAVNYISSFLAHPDELSGARLPLLQALVVELGICNPSSQLPASVRAAKALLKAHAHINVRDYIASRGNGVEALQKVMFPNRSQLLKDLRKRRVPLQWIKDHGLSMFLLSLS